MDSDGIAAISAAITSVLSYVLRPIFVFLHRESVYYWPYLVVTIVVALGFHLLWRHQGWRAFLRLYCSKELWWHPSARADYLFHILNGILYPLIFAPMVLSSLTVAGWVRGLFGGSVEGVLGGWGWGPMLGFSVLFFVVYDLGRFISHSVLHDVPLLWEFHKLHHSAEVLVPFTASRIHPVDLMVMTFFPNLLTGLTLGMFQAVWGDSVSYYTFFGLQAALMTFDALAHLKHWQVPISYGWLETVLVSPVMHQVHHSRLPQHWGLNRGSDLAIWDRMMGTYYRPVPGEEMPFGLGDGTDGQWHRMGRMMGWPFKLALSRLRP